MNFSDFEKQEHQKRVAHMARYIKSTGSNTLLKDAVEIFGHTEEQCQVIVSDAIKQIAH